jgi:hypothetical protein
VCSLLLLQWLRRHCYDISYIISLQNKGSTITKEKQGFVINWSYQSKGEAEVGSWEITHYTMRAPFKWTINLYQWQLCSIDPQ